MVVSSIYYSIMPHPVQDKWWGDNVYWKVHHVEGDEPIIIPKSKFSHYWRLMSTEYTADLESLFAQYNDEGYGGHKNPLATPEGQAKVKSSGTHHTSMSVGDVIKVGKKYYIVAGVGFKELILK